MTELVAKLTRRVTELEEALKASQVEVSLLKLKLFGSKSEKRLPENPDQLKIEFEEFKSPEEEKEIVSIKEEIQVESYKRRTSTKVTNKPTEPRLPDYLERRDVILEPQDIDLSKCEKIGEDVREILEMTPQSFYIRRIIRPKYKLKEDKDNENLSTQIIQHPAVESFFPKSYAGDSILANLVVGKYIDHLPVYRQVSMFKRLGVNLSYSTLNAWVHQLASALYPLYDLQVQIILASNYIQVDETILLVVNKENSKTVKGYVWLVHDVLNKQVCFHYDQGCRTQKIVISLLKNYQGYIQTDGYAAYDIYENKKGVTLLGCWTHARRKFVEATVENKELANKALEYIGLLYEIEANMKYEELSVQAIYFHRRRQAYPLIKEFEQWMQSVVQKVTDKSLMKKALAYTIERMKRLSHYVNNGDLLIDNNLIENAVRPLALGRKNYLFCDNNHTAQNTALFYTFFGTCKLLEINPNDWFLDVLAKIKDTKRNDLYTLLPKYWKK